MKTLQDNFCLLRFGIITRLVQVSDAEFIYRLRSDKYLTRHIHPFDGTLEDQIQWINGYKEREQQGKEFYFIYEKKGKPFGVNRIYSIEDNHGTTGSWICIPGSSPIDVLATSIILYDLCFDELQFEKVFYDTRKDNTSALKVNRALGGVYLYEKNEDLYFELLPENYHSVRDRLLKTWRIK